MDYPQALVEKVARRLAIWNDDEDPVKGVIWQPYIGDAVAALDALGLHEETVAPYSNDLKFRQRRYVTDWEAIRD